MKGITKLILLVIFMLVTAVFSLIILPWVNRLIGSPVTAEVVLKPKYFDATADHALISLLEITEESTGKSIQELLALSVHGNSKEITLDGKTVNLDSIISKEMGILVLSRTYFISAGSLEFGDEEVVEKNYCSTSKISLIDLEKEDVMLCLG